MRQKSISVKEKIKLLEREVRSLRSLVLSLVATDKEGEYRPEFVKEILRDSSEPSVGVFVDEASFLRAVKNV